MGKLILQKKLKFQIISYVKIRIHRNNRKDIGKMISKKESLLRESNPGPFAYEANALPTKLNRQAELH